MGKIKAVALDVDGVLTDGFFYWGTEGQEYKRFSFRDVMGISLGKKAGLVFALISGEDNPLVLRFAEKMGIVDVYKGCKDKGSALKDFAGKRGLELSEICFLGDDVNDIGALGLAGLAAAPANAHELAKDASGLILKSNGGDGAVRELIDVILREVGEGL